VPEGNAFNDWIKAGSDFSMLNVSDAFHGLMRLNPELQESTAFNTLQTSMTSIMGENGAMQAKNTSRIVWALNKVDSGMEISDFVDTMKKNKIGLTEKKRSPESGLSL
jgi:ABC-type Na+ transport system ATPase subunit NatA